MAAQSHRQAAAKCTALPSLIKLPVTTYLNPLEFQDSRLCPFSHQMSFLDAWSQLLKHCLQGPRLAQASSPHWSPL